MTARPAPTRGGSSTTMSARPDGSALERGRQEPGHRALVQRDVGQLVQVAARVGDGSRVALDRGDGTARADPVGDGRREQADAAVEVERALAALRGQLLAGRSRRRSRAAAGCTCQKPAPVTRNSCRQSPAGHDLPDPGAPAHPGQRPAGWPGRRRPARRPRRRRPRGILVRRVAPAVGVTTTSRWSSVTLAATSTAAAPGQVWARCPAGRGGWVRDRAGLDGDQVVRAVPPGSRAAPGRSPPCCTRVRQPRPSGAAGQGLDRHVGDPARRARPAGAAARGRPSSSAPRWACERRVLPVAAAAPARPGRRAGRRHPVRRGAERPRPRRPAGTATPRRPR